MNLKCRMHKARLPNIGDVVMVKVRSVTEEGANVTLVEYNNIPGFIKGGFSCIVGRREPRTVRRIEEGAIRINKKRVSFEAKHAFLPRFLKMRHFHSIMKDVARDVGFDLEQLYNLTGWPRYEDLRSPQSPYWNDICLKDAVKASMLRRLATTVYNSWRITNSHLLGPATIAQIRFLCWAFSICRQIDFQLKSKGMIEEHDFISVQDLINKAGHFGIVNPDGSLTDLADLGNPLLCFGLVRERLCPLTQLVGQDWDNINEDKTQVIYPKAFEVFRVSDYSAADWDMRLKTQRAYGAFTVTVLWYNSYQANIKGKKIYRPTEEELRLSDEEILEQDIFVHSLALTGDGVDGNGNPYWELQDSSGDVDNGDSGFLFFSRYPNVIIEYVDIEV